MRVFSSTQSVRSRGTHRRRCRPCGLRRRIEAERLGADTTCDSSSYCKTFSINGTGGGVEATATRRTAIQGQTSAGNGDSGVAGIDTATACASGCALAAVEGSSSGGSGGYFESTLQGSAGVHGYIGKSTQSLAL
jgi:hypothetical protein